MPLVATMLILASSIALFLGCFSGLTYVSKEKEDLKTLSNFLGLISFFLVTSLSILLFYYFFTDNFGILYVYKYSSADLKWYYKLSAFWAGKEGTILLWIWFILLFYVFLLRIESKNEFVYWTTKVLILMVALIFILAMKKYSDPFQQIFPEPKSGYGLNPLLKDPWMIIHPPITFLGYAASTVPFAASISHLIFVLRGLIGGEKIDDSNTDWEEIARPFARWGWLFLSLGIAIGGFWSYKVLGWGGFWAWDPVETASLVPWLIWSGYLHSSTLLRSMKMRGDESTRILNPLSMFLAVLCFVLVIFATLATRSGLFRDISPHSF
ncbi:MAG: cytochrome c biogenesis protein CcsA [Candidatus Hydrothermarchaeota archaeon]